MYFGVCDIQHADFHFGQNAWRVLKHSHQISGVACVADEIQCIYIIYIY